MVDAAVCTFEESFKKLTTEGEATKELGGSQAAELMETIKQDVLKVGVRVGLSARSLAVFTFCEFSSIVSLLLRFHSFCIPREEDERTMIGLICLVTVSRCLGL